MQGKRSTGIGSSEIAAICGLNKWRAPIDVYMSKLGLVEEQEDNDNMYFGREIEPILIKRYEKETGRKVFVYSQEIMPLRHPMYDWFMYSPDGVILNSGGNTEGICEAKTTGFAHIDDWGEAGSDNIPESYLIQCQWLMEGTGALWADVPVLFMGARREFKVYRVNRDDELIATLIEKGKDFWEYHVLPQVPPSVDASPGWDKYFKKTWPREDEDLITIDGDPLIAEYILATKEYKFYEKYLTELQNKLKTWIGSHAGLAFNEGKITWKKSKDRIVIDWPAAFNEVYQYWISNVNAHESQEAILKDFTTTKPGPRIFRTTFKEESDE